MFDDFEKDPFEWSRQPGAEKRVNDYVVRSAWLGNIFPLTDSFTLDKGQRRGRFGRAGFKTG